MLVTNKAKYVVKKDEGIHIQCKSKVKFTTTVNFIDELEFGTVPLKYMFFLMAHMYVIIM